jgi:hypothetical protein
MKKIIGVLAIYASLAVLVVAAFANVTELKAQTPTPTPASAQGPCTDEAKGAWYGDFTKFRTTEPAKAYEAAKKYLAACPTEEGQIPAYLKKWVAAYDKEARKLKFQPLLYNDKKYPEAFAIGKEILADDPENLRVLIDLGWGNYLAAITLKNESYNNDSLMYARKAIQLIEANKAPASWAPFKSKEDTLAYLYNAVGRISLKANPAEALPFLIKAAQAETELKKDPWTYFFIAAAYEAGPYAKLSEEYKACCEGKDETPQSKLALANIQQVIDRMVDAYARAVALAGNDPKYQANKPAWMEGLTTWYKYRHNQSDAGLNEMIAGVLSKPLPPVPTPLTTLPASTPTTSPTSGALNAAGANVSTTTGTNPTTTPSTTAPKPTTTITPATSTKPKPTTTTPPKPRTRRNHRGR